MWLEIALLMIGVALTGLTAIFVSSEFSLVALDQAAVENHAERGDRSAARVLTAMKSLSTQLSGAQVGITLTTILLGYTAQQAAARLLTDALGHAGLATALATSIGVIVAAVLINLFSMLFGELVPKNIAMAHPLRTGGQVAPVQMAFTALFRPLIAVLNGTANWVLHRMGIEPQEEISSARSASELAAMVRHSADEGTLDASAATLFTRSIHIEELTAVDVMTDRGLVRTLPEQATAADVISLAAETGHSRFPVLGAGTDEILGLASVRRAVGVPWKRRAEVPVISSSLLDPAPRVPETLELPQLLVQLRDEGLQMAVVVNEYGGVSGVVTLEDAVEEIVGDVADEHDQRRAGIRYQPDGAILVPGRLRPDELADRTGVKVPEDGRYETLGGLVMSVLGRIPVIGDEVWTDDDIQIVVTRMVGRRVSQVLVRPAPEEPSGTAHRSANGAREDS
ncbi:hemolysin family protein [Acidipropionibacterium thoenii]|uniref:hemolysin family protein n=1 Tax=Acidipropionibacterium thoenii TaxID=1751 RepID=UPI0004236916|nr:hemolysin family protein [Acidipropionibacterium thoenii]